MHSCRMRTARRLTVSGGLSSEEGVCLLRRRIFLPHGVVGRQTPCEQTNVYENITFLQLPLCAVKRDTLERKYYTFKYSIFFWIIVVSFGAVAGGIVGVLVLIFLVVVIGLISQR